MKDSKRQTIRDVVLVFLGVLLGLAANAAWESHQDRVRLRATIANLRAVTRENERRFQSALALDSIAADRAERAIWALRRRTPVSPDSLTSWIFRSLYFSDFHPLTGVYNSVISSGDITLLSDSLRVLLPQLTGELEGASDEMRVFDRRSIDNIADAGRIVDVAQVSAWWNGRDHYWPAFTQITSEELSELRPLDPAELKNSRALQQVLVNNYINAQNRTFLVRSAIAQTRAFEAALNRERHE